MANKINVLECGPRDGWQNLKQMLTFEQKLDLIDRLFDAGVTQMEVTSFVSPIRKLANFAEMFSNGFAGLNRFAELMRTEPTIQDAPDAVELTEVQGAVDVDHVSFAYTDETEVLHDVSLSIPAGETVALVGPSGGGKSTLCQLLPRFYDVDEGSIRIDGLDVRQVTQSSLRRAIGIVQQDVFLFADTIRERLQDFITEYRTHKARIELNHMHEIVNNAYLNYMKKQKEYADYCDSHQDLVLEAYKAKAENLENELQLAFNAYSGAKTQETIAQAKVLSKTPAFTTLQNATVPLRPAGPKRMMFAIVMAMLCFLVQTVYFIAKDVKKMEVDNEA